MSAPHLKLQNELQKEMNKTLSESSTLATSSKEKTLCVAYAVLKINVNYDDESKFCLEFEII